MIVDQNEAGRVECLCLIDAFLAVPDQMCAAILLMIRSLPAGDDA